MLYYCPDSPGKPILGLQCALFELPESRVGRGLSYACARPPLCCVVWSLITEIVAHTRRGRADGRTYQRPEALDVLTGGLPRENSVCFQEVGGYCRSSNRATDGVADSWGSGQGLSTLPPSRLLPMLRSAMDATELRPDCRHNPHYRGCVPPFTRLSDTIASMYH